MEPRLRGSRVLRIEDPELLHGSAKFVDDVSIPGVLHAAFVRSPHAHALICDIDVTAALGSHGVQAVFTASDLRSLLAQPRLPIAFPDGQLPPNVMPLVMADTEVLHVGEAVAVVIATSRALAEDAAERVVVEYQPLPAVIDPHDALAAGPSSACTGTASSIFTRLVIGYGNCATAFAAADHVFREQLVQHRGVSHPLEGRGLVARHDTASGQLTVWSSTQMSHELRQTLAHMLAVPEDLVRVIAPEVGGGFGTKYMVYPEEIVVATAARHIGAAVKWIEDRREHFISAIQERDQHWNLEIAVNADGRIRGIRGTLLHDQGAYAPHSVNVPFNSAVSLPGAYVVPHYHLDVIVARTNLVPVIPVRGAGYPQGCFAIERLLDLVARKLDIDRVELRRRNLVPAEQMPYQTPMKTRAGSAIVYDSGDYLSCQNKGLAAIDFGGFEARRAAARRKGRYIGIGMAHGVKGTGRGPFESGTVRLTPAGRACVYTGALAMGQGLKTALAQICADELGMPLDRIDVVTGDTGFVSLGLGGYASRQMVTAGSSVLQASLSVRAKALQVASQMLEAAEADLTVTNGVVHVIGVPQMGVTLGKISSALRGLPGYGFPQNVAPGLEATEHFRVDSLAYSNAFHVCEVDVDIETGAVEILRYVAVNDSGRLVNPMIVEGQLRGGIVHGIGNALFEQMVYSASGQPLTTSLADYLLPTAPSIPRLEILMQETPSPLNPLGVKGVGENGVIPVTAALASAVEHALEPFGVHVTQTPILPARLLEMILAGRQEVTS